MQIDKGTLIFGIIIAIFIVHFFNFVVLGWCVLATIVIIIIAFFYKIFVDEKRIPSIVEWPKRIWKGYLKFESKVFNWIDRHF